MIELDHHVAGAKMRIGDDVAHVEYRAERHMAAEHLHQLAPGELSRQGADLRIDRILVSGARFPRGETLLAAELRAAELFAQRGPELVLVAGERDDTVARRHPPQRRQERVPVALGARHPAPRGILMHKAL